MNKILLRMAACSTLLIFPVAVNADSGTDLLHQLQARLHDVEARLATLESIKPTFTNFMPDIAERFHVMHRAGYVGDWAVSGHELAELKRLTNTATGIDKTKGDMMKGFMSGPYEALEHAIENGDLATFEKALAATVQSCNACHVTTGSPFIKVLLDETNSLSMRHPHQLSRSSKAIGHAHGGDQHDKMEEMMGDDHGDVGDDHHDDEKKPHQH